MYINSRESISDAQNTALFSSSFSLKKKLFAFALLYCFTDLNHLTVCLDFRNAPNLFINYWVNYTPLPQGILQNDNKPQT
jgi:hypothetical protein